MDRGSRHLWSHTSAALLLALGGATLGASLLGCNSAKPAEDITIERLPDVNPNLPAVPTLPAPSHPAQYPDQSYSVFGVRRRMHQTMNTDVAVTGYIVSIYEPPECPPDRACPLPRRPHLFIADSKDERDTANLLRLTRYADNHTEVAEAVEALRRNRPLQREEGDDRPPIPGDFGVGAKINVRGKFVRLSGETGYLDSEGLLEYLGHTTIEPAPEAPAERAR
jgi:hypothetical protein